MMRNEDIIINLLEKENVNIRRYSKSIAAVSFTLILTAAMVFYYFNAQAQLSSLLTANQQLKAAYARSYERLEHTGKKQDTLTVLRDREEIIALIEQQNDSAAEILEKIENAVPAEAMLIEAEIGSEQVVLKGFAPAYSQAAEVLSRLQEDSPFQEAELLSCCYNEELHEVEFELVLKREEKQY